MAMSNTLPTVNLPEPPLTSGMSIEVGLLARRSVREFQPGALTIAEVSQPSSSDKLRPPLARTLNLHQPAFHHLANLVPGERVTSVRYRRGIDEQRHGHVVALDQREHVRIDGFVSVIRG